jgi:hypothetical protein
MTDLKTTVLGFLGAFWFLAQPIITNGNFDFARDWKSLVFAGLTAAFGYFVGDKKPTE